MKDESKLLNPDIREITYGKKQLQKLTLYPLSVGDQFKVTDIVSGCIQKLIEGQKSGMLSDYLFMTTIMEMIEANIGKILVLISDITEEESKVVISQLTNTQLIEIIESIWLVDYEPMLKKGKSLFDRGRSVFNLKKSLPDSSNTFPSIGSKTSIEKDIVTEE